MGIINLKLVKFVMIHMKQQVHMTILFVYLNNLDSQY
jgi:hypothetical protein